MHYSDSHYTAVGRGAADEGRGDVQKKKKKKVVSSAFRVSPLHDTVHRLFRRAFNTSFYYIPLHERARAHTHTHTPLYARVCVNSSTLCIAAVRPEYNVSFYRTRINMLYSVFDGKGNAT